MYKLCGSEFITQNSCKMENKREMSNIDVNRGITVQGQAGYVFPPFPS